MPINKLQIIGSHNSYKKAIDRPLFDLLRKYDSAGTMTIDYSHISLHEQLNIGLHNLEIDFYADTAGGKYAHPAGLQWTPGNQDLVTQFDSSLMKEPGFKVLHIQDIDFRSGCLTLSRCLRELKSGSESHPLHVPVFVTVNAKDDTIPAKSLIFERQAPLYQLRAWRGGCGYLDYYLPSEFFKSDYVIRFDDGKYLRANPFFSPN